MSNVSEDDRRAIDILHSSSEESKTSHEAGPPHFKHRFLGRRTAHQWIAAGRVRVNEAVITDSQHEVDRFMNVTLDAETVQQAERALYLDAAQAGGHPQCDQG